MPGVKATLLAVEGHQPLGMAGLAAHMQETILRLVASQIGIKFAMNVVW
ncbi:MAG: hypothetical protein GY935_18170 [Gammaproteobacteria bacterium]|nr:hypothetical protein [Gammaproteobacteria bacterium]